MPNLLIGLSCKVLILNSPKIVKKSDLLSSYAPYKSLQKKIDINKESKNKEEVSRLQKEKQVLEKKIIDISVSAIGDMFEENTLDRSEEHTSELQSPDHIV